MVQPENWVESGSVGIGHQAGKLWISRIAAPHQTVHPVVRLRFNAAMHAPAMLEPRVDAAKAGAASAGDPGELGIGHSLEVDLMNGHINLAVVIGSVTLLDEEWIVAMSVRPVRRCESRRQLELIGFEIIPIWQRPIRRSAEFSHRRADVRLEGEEIAAMPRQKIPAPVLTLLPETFHIGSVRHRVGRTQVTEFLPKRRIEAVDRAVETPACRF